MNTTIDMNIYYPESIHFGMFAPWAHINAWSAADSHGGRDDAENIYGIREVAL